MRLLRRHGTAAALELKGIGQQRPAHRHRALLLRATWGGDDQPVRLRAAVLEHYGIGQQRPAPRHRALWRLATRGGIRRRARELREAASLELGGIVRLHVALSLPSLWRRASRWAPSQATLCQPVALAPAQRVGAGTCAVARASSSAAPAPFLIGLRAAT